MTYPRTLRESPKCTNYMRDKQKAKAKKKDASGLVFVTGQVTSGHVMSVSRDEDWGGVLGSANAIKGKTEEKK